MTRFARAKGSKASNERKEEDPTPWHILRQQLAEQLKTQNDCEKVPSFSDSTTNIVVCKPEEEAWSEFNDFKLNKSSLIKDTKTKTLEKLPKLQNEKVCMKKTNLIKEDNILSKLSLSKIKKNTVKNITKPDQTGFTLEKGKSNKSQTKMTTPKVSTHTKANDKNKLRQGQSNADSCTIQTTEKPTIVKEHEVVRFNDNAYVNKNTKKISTERTGKKLKTSQLKASEDTNIEKEHIKLTLSTNPKYLTPNISQIGSKEKRISNKNNHSSNVQTIIANGRKIEIVKYEAFWIKKDDANKLKELKKKLKDQKMPNEKIKTIIKLERRRAEKALSREKTNVCYHCRKFGHNFSECPEISNSNMSKSGICFKCGSTEHTHFECKVTHSQNFRYAVCFVCNEQGHISRQCSLNPQGQYPKGGSCHLCGEVTHLRKDCPKAFEEKPSSFVTVEKINSVGLEDVSEIKTNNKKQNLVKNKVVLF